MKRVHIAYLSFGFTSIIAKPQLHIFIQMIGKYVPPLDSLYNMGSIAAGAQASLCTPGAARATCAADTTEGGCR